jgi:hypothetical protein
VGFDFFQRNVLTWSLLFTYERGMATSLQLTALDENALRALPGFKTTKQFEDKFPKRSSSTAELKAAQLKWVKSIKPPEVKEPAATPIQAVKLTADHVDKLRAVHESTAATAELVNQKLDSDKLFGILYSSLTALEYTRLNSEYKKRLSEAANKETVEAQWQKVVAAAQGAFAAAGVKDLKPTQLDEMAAELNRRKANFNAVTTIANSARNVTEAKATKAVGYFVPQTAVLPDLVGVALTIPVLVWPKLCQQPLAQGSFTKHFGAQFNLTVTLTVWCPTWSNPFRTCLKTYTLAGVSFSVDVTVGYKVTCCGASAWGQAAVQACASLLGITFCANCTASITGVAGVAKSGSGSSCTYGLGINATLTCQFAGFTVLSLNAPFGWTVSGPCPPAGWIC